MQMSPISHSLSRRGFSLIEVVLAIGIFLVTVLALVGLLGPTLQSVNEVEETDDVSSVVNTLNAFLQSSPDIAPTGDSKFNAIFNAVANDGFATLVMYRWYDDLAKENEDSPPVIKLEIGFIDDEQSSINPRGVVNSDRDGNPASYQDAANQIYRIVLSPSSVIPLDLRSSEPNPDTGVYSLNSPNIASYPEGYFAMEARIFALESDMSAVSSGTLPNVSLEDLVNEEAVFTYNTAIVR